ncbi:hypothetical protein PISMIDRAFT_16020 [Pisolithus microcarpus 441]|uniref:Uncharacterized protein n=1 Tax=Pisolithus microcarpus 441 TaxID=765257 RepID=A0A0C9Z8F5_9AGAM|nr:hypothetical protein PISMIDRAFT_16020 [Pisolithus microcarpus 441]
MSLASSSCEAPAVGEGSMVSGAQLSAGVYNDDIGETWPMYTDPVHTTNMNTPDSLDSNIILILSADYEEQAVMALIHGIKSNFPCPICLIPHDRISDFPAQCELRTSKNILKVLWEVHSQDTTEKKEQILIEQGLHDVDSAFTVVMNMDVYHALSWDCLHTNFAGMFGDHLWPELLRILDRARRPAMARVKKNFSEMPRWHMLNHFDKALSISYTNGQKLEDLSKGVTRNFNTKPNEKMHGPLKEKYQKLTNFKNVAQQILVVDHLEAVSELIHCKISDYDAYTETNVMQNSADGDTNDVEQEDFFHVRLGSCIKQPSSLEAIEQRSVIDKVFTQFCMKLNELLNRYFEVMQKPCLGGKHIQLQANHEV